MVHYYSLQINWFFKIKRFLRSSISFIFIILLPAGCRGGREAVGGGGGRGAQLRQRDACARDPEAPAEVAARGSALSRRRATIIGVAAQASAFSRRRATIIRVLHAPETETDQRKGEDVFRGRGRTATTSRQSLSKEEASATVGTEIEEAGLKKDGGKKQAVYVAPPVAPTTVRLRRGGDDGGAGAGAGPEAGGRGCRREAPGVPGLHLEVILGLPSATKVAPGTLLHRNS